MINLKDLLTLRNMQYRNAPKEKHTKQMLMETPNFVDMIIPYKPPSENDSRETLGELKYISELESDQKYAEDYDKVEKAFIKLLKEFKVHTKQREDIINQIVDQSKKFILTAKKFSFKF